MIATAYATAVVGQLDIEGYTEALEPLKAAAPARVDQNFSVAAVSLSNRYRNIQISDSALVSNGNYYSEESAKAGGAIGQGGIMIRRHPHQQRPKVQNGDMFGGVNIFGA